MILPLLIAQNLGIPDLGLLLLKVLAVAGAAALGGLGTGLAVQFLCRVAVHRALPRSLLLLVRVLGAALFGLLVWLWVFSAGGTGGMGGGGGWWPFGGTGGHGANQTAPSSTTKVTQPPITAPNPSAKKVRVHLLGGQRVRAQRYYLLDDEVAPHDWQELRALLTERREKEPTVKVLEIVLYLDSVDRDNPAVAILKEWAEGQGYTVTLSFPATKAP